MTAIKYVDDIELVKEIKEKLAANDGYCPCRLDKTPDTKCMCKEFRDQVRNKEIGAECHCGLYEIIEIKTPAPKKD